MSATKQNVKNLTVSAICLALCMVLPFLTGQIPEVGQVLSPMHIPVLLAGFAAGPVYAAAVGLTAPVLRFLVFQSPPPIPMGIAMTFELAAYGAVAGVLYKLLPKKIPYVYVTLIAAMVLGRVAWGAAMAQLVRIAELPPMFAWLEPFTFEVFIGAVLINSWPGIVLHIVLIPIIVVALKKARLLE